MLRKTLLYTTAALLCSNLTASALFGFGKKDAEEAPAMTEMAGDFTPVKSSLLKAVKYDESAETLAIQFVKGHTYEYTGVPKKVFDELMSSESKGKYFTAHIKDKFQGVKQ